MATPGSSSLPHPARSRTPARGRATDRAASSLDGVAPGRARSHPPHSGRAGLDRRREGGVRRPPPRGPLPPGPVRLARGFRHRRRGDGRVGVLHHLLRAGHGAGDRAAPHARAAARTGGVLRLGRLRPGAGSDALGARATDRRVLPHPRRPACPPHIRLDVPVGRALARGVRRDAASAAVPVVGHRRPGELRHRLRRRRYHAGTARVRGVGAGGGGDVEGGPVHDHSGGRAPAALHDPAGSQSVRRADVLRQRLHRLQSRQLSGAAARQRHRRPLARSGRPGFLRTRVRADGRGPAAMALVTLPLSALLVVLAPEAVPVLLGPKWTPVIVPFQILTLGIFLRTSYRISDVVARATGAVYRRAWRQATYMLCVVAGAWFGRRWGIAGVALGVLGALAVNYLLMAHLGLRLAGLSWRRFWQAHLHALVTAAVVAALVGGLAPLLRAWGVPDIAVLVTAGGLGLGGTLLLVRAAPRVFLGADGLWLLEQVRRLVSSRGAPSAATSPAAASLPGEEPLLALVRQLGEVLAREGVHYCQWKGHSKRHRWATGAGDIDLLVDPVDKGRLASVLKQLGFIVALAPPEERLPGVVSYFGLDRGTGKLVHVHAHERLFLGRPWAAARALPMEGLFLASAAQGSVFRTPAPEIELIGLVLRTVERRRLTEVAQQELSDLEARSDPTRLARALEQVPFLDARFFAACRQSLSPDCPARTRLLLRWRLLRRLRTRAVRPPIAAAFLRLLHRARMLANRRSGAPGKRLAPRGVVIALGGRSEERRVGKE